MDFNKAKYEASLLEKYGDIFPKSFVEAVRNGVTWLANHNGITYQTSTMIATDAVVYENNKSSLLRIGLINVDQPLGGLTYYEVKSIKEEIDSVSGNPVFKVECKYHAPVGIKITLIPIAYFNPNDNSGELYYTKEEIGNLIGSLRSSILDDVKVEINNSLLPLQTNIKEIADAVIGQEKPVNPDLKPDNNNTIIIQGATIREQLHSLALAIQDLTLDKNDIDTRLQTAESNLNSIFIANPDLNSPEAVLPAFYTKEQVDAMVNNKVNVVDFENYKLAAEVRYAVKEELDDGNGLPDKEEGDKDEQVPVFPNQGDPEEQKRQEELDHYTRKLPIPPVKYEVNKLSLGQLYEQLERCYVYMDDLNSLNNDISKIYNNPKLAYLKADISNFMVKTNLYVVELELQIAKEEKNLAEGGTPTPPYVPEEKPTTPETGEGGDNGNGEGGSEGGDNKPEQPDVEPKPILPNQGNEEEQRQQAELETLTQSLPIPPTKPEDVTKLELGALYQLLEDYTVYQDDLKVLEDQATKLLPNNPKLEYLIADLHRFTGIATANVTEIEKLITAKEEELNKGDGNTTEKPEGGKDETEQKPTGKKKIVKFDKNGGEGEMANVEVALPETGVVKYTLPASTFTPPKDKEFKEWAEDAKGKNPRAANSEIDFGKEGEITFFAIYQDKQAVTPPEPEKPKEETTLDVKNNKAEMKVNEKLVLEITTNAADFSLESSDVDIVKVDKDKKELSAVKVGKAKITIKATKEGSTEKKVEFDVDVKEDVKTKPITFNANGGKGTMEQVNAPLGDWKVVENKFTAPDGKQFKTWAQAANGDKPQAPGSTLVLGTEKPLELFAIWEDIPKAPEGGDKAPTTEENKTPTEGGDANKTPEATTPKTEEKQPEAPKA